MNNDVVGFGLAQNTRGAVAVEHLIALVLVGIVGIGSLTQFGQGTQQAIAGEADGKAQTSRAALITSRQAAAGELVHVAQAVAKPFEVVERLGPKPSGLGKVLDIMGTGDFDSELAGAARTIHARTPAGVRVHLNLPKGDAPAGGFPVAAHYSGLAGGSRFYETVPGELLKAGIAVALVELPNNLEMSLAKRVRHAKSALDVVEKLDAPINLEKMYAIGHSFGGATSFVLSAFDSRIKRMVGFAPGFPPSDILASLVRGRMPRRNALMERALAEENHAPRLIIGAEHDMVVPPAHYSEPMARACTAGSHCTHVNLEKSGHANFVDVPFPRVPMWVPTLRNPFRVLKVDLTALSFRVRTGRSQREAAAKLAVAFLTQP